MALLSEKERQEYFDFLGLGEYNTTNIKKFQKMAMRSKDVDGKYGPLTDTALRHFYNVKKYTKNFNPEEFKCECGGRYCTGYPDYMKPCELQHIQLIRDHYGKPITVTSGLRCKGYNNSLAGSIKNSPHLTGYAIDFYQAGVTDSYANRKAAIKYFKTLPNHNYTYGNGLDSNGYGISASYMGNALHTDTKPGANAQTSDQDTGLRVDGVMGPATVRQFQVFLGAVVQDGVISGQNKNYKKYYPALTSVQFGKGGSFCIRLAQRWLGITEDGVWGPETSKAMQKKLGVKQDGIFGPASCKALQKYLNTHDKADFPVTPKPTPTNKFKVIDVSSHQGKINWKKVKADGVVGAIIRYADDDVIDTYFDVNMKGAINAGLHVGTYIYSRAKNKAQAERDAVNLYNASKPYIDKIDMPMYIDLEQKGLERYASTVAKAFLNKMEKLGVKKYGVYANLSWWNNYLTDVYPPSRWVAQYYSKCQYKGNYDIWQYTSEGSVNGISGVVDMDWCYKELWK